MRGPNLLSPLQRWNRWGLAKREIARVRGAPRRSPGTGRQQDKGVEGRGDVANHLGSGISNDEGPTEGAISRISSLPMRRCKADGETGLDYRIPMCRWKSTAPGDNRRREDFNFDLQYVRCTGLLLPGVRQSTAPAGL